MTSAGNVPSIIGGGDLSSFLSKKQKATGNVATIGILAGLGYVVYHAAPIALKAFETVTMGLANGLVTGIEVGAVGVFAYILLQKGTWTRFRVIYGALAKKSTKLMFNVLETDMLRWIADEYLQEKYNAFSNSQAFVEGKRDRTKGIVEDNAETIKQSFREAQGLQQAHFESGAWGNEDAQARYRILSDKIDLLRSSNNKLEKTLERQNLYCKALEKWGRGYLIQMETTRNLVTVLETEYEASKGMAECSEAFSAVLPGSDMGQIFQASIDACKDRITQYNSKAEQFARMLPQLMADPDLKSDANEANLLKEIERWDEVASTSLSEIETEKLQIKDGGAAGVAGFISSSTATAFETSTKKKKYSLK